MMMKMMYKEESVYVCMFFIKYVELSHTKIYYKRQRGLLYLHIYMANSCLQIIEFEVTNRFNEMS